MASLSAACGVGGQKSPEVPDDNSVPFGLLKPNAPTVLPPAAAEDTDDVMVCFIEADAVSPLRRPIDAPVSLADVVAAMAEPPADSPALRTALGPTRLVETVVLNAGVVTVDLTGAVAALGAKNQLLAIAQLVCALTARPGVGQVAFSLAGSPVDVPRGDGSLTAAPVSRDDYAAILK